MRQVVRRANTSVSGPVPVTPESPMFMPAALDGFEGSVDLAAHGYVEEEYFFSGVANIYDYDDHDTDGAGIGRRVAVREGVPYRTRFVVRRPLDPQRSSGVVHLEILNPSARYDVGHTWAQAWRSILHHGHTFVGLTSKANAVEALKLFNPQRYGELDFEELGLVWDVIADFGDFLHSDAGSELVGAERTPVVIASGWSQTGAFLRTFLAEGFHRDATARDGRPPIDAYLLGVSSGQFVFGYSPLNAARGPEMFDPETVAARRTIPLLDPRRTVQPREAPVIEFLTEAEAVENWLSRRPDSDDPADPYRLYEVPGRGHRAVSSNPIRDIPAAQMRSVGFARPFVAGVSPVREATEDHRTDWVVEAAFEHLRRWVIDGVPPPRADPIVIDFRVAKRAIADEFGNAVGGVRTPFFTVPLATYRSVTPDEPLSEGPITPWELIPFARERAVELYGDAGGYLRRFAEELDRTIDRGWYLPEHRAAVLAEAQDLAVRVFGPVHNTQKETP